MNTYIINNKFLICAESATIAKNLDECKFGQVSSVVPLGEYNASN